ncbi:Transcription factor ORG2-like [Melia azedarach]|uniref:Transcription factor ORG2-like n=1 Tax=Melia azedarach TaxID=155640 RepID=A0ACC1YLN8_MELAZ|nr:Transcription factor ORG2-like [Melia azedarach]
MCALSPPVFANLGWPSEQYHHQLQQQEDYYYYSHRETADHDRQYLVTQPQIQLAHCASFSANAGDDAVAKKLYHNASERDRRKKINGLYSALRSILPDADQTKRLSIPATISLVVKYLPELQQQMKRLEEKKEELLSKISTQHDDLINIIHQRKQKQVVVGSNLFSVSVSRLTEREILIHISTYKTNYCPLLLSEILLHLQEDHSLLLLLSASSFESSGKRVFYSLHLQVERAYELADCEVINEKLKSLYEKREEGTLFPSNLNLDVKIN